MKALRDTTKARGEWCLHVRLPAQAKTEREKDSAAWPRQLPINS
jgi:hypothetical protein